MIPYSSLQLAFIGDAIHTCFVRLFVLKNFNHKMNSVNLISSKLCSAKFQSTVLDKLDLISPEEEDVVRMARNAKPKHSAKNSNPAEYHKATAFEALIGWLYLTKNEQRLNEVLNFSVKEAIDEH